jgi:aminoglycoside phosphotransferase (APT) family kinase protein
LAYAQALDEAGQPVSSVVVEGRAGEGDSLENWFFSLMRDGVEQRRVLRRNGLTVATESDRRREYEVLARLQEAGLPIPRVEWLDDTGQYFGRAGFTMGRCEGAADLLALTPGNRYGWDEATRLDLARRFTQLMAHIHGVDWRGLGLGDVLDVPPAPIAETRLQTILAEIERYRLEPYPEIDETVDWLRQRLPDPCDVVLTHGDFRVVQALLSPDAHIRALLDWEFVRLSDPIEELAHFLMPPMIPLHTIPGVWEAEDFVRDYEAVTGTDIDRTSLAWWRALNMLWVISFLLRTLSGIIDNSVNGVRTHAFVARLLGMLLSLTHA